MTCYIKLSGIITERYDKYIIFHPDDDSLNKLNNIKNLKKNKYNKNPFINSIHIKIRISKYSYLELNTLITIKVKISYYSFINDKKNRITGWYLKL
jgi:hypothetical protein